ncbi:N-6 DNA methylase [Candidatus Gracilibacteria bacterium]|nr:N-6 DNA methylase [Candidatus Gracilibacteria bacterium]
MKQQISRITDILRRDDGISGAMHYTEQISWILFLKFLDDYEQRENDNAFLDGKTYNYILEEKFRWKNWIHLQNGKITGDDLKDFVNKELFPYLKSFRNINEDYHSIKYKIGEIYHFIDNRIESGHTLREILDIIDDLNFQKQEDLFELSHIYEDLLQGMGNDGGNSGEFYTPRSIIKIMVDTIDPKIGQTVYDPSTGSCGFLIEAFNHMNSQEKNDKELEFLKNKTFFGNEKTGLAYIMGVMNMILHGINNPNISKKNTLTQDIRQIQEKDRYDIILANPPFGGKEKELIQNNFPFKTNATEMLFLQHIYKNLKLGGKAGIIIPEGVLFNTGNAFQDIKKELLENYNLHSIISLPAGVFLPYSGVKTNVIFFDREGSTKDIWYYEINLGRTLTKNKPITYEEIKEIPNLLKKREISENSWIINVNDIKDYDLSAKNPNKAKEEALRSPLEIIENIEKNDDEIKVLVSELRKIIK